MRTFYNDLDIKFSIGGIKFHALSFALEKFMRAIPSHSHSNNSYEIHYIPYGRGQVKIDGAAYEIVPNTLYVTGPNIEHEQIPFKEDPMVEYCIYFKIERTKTSRRGIDANGDAKETSNINSNIDTENASHNSIKRSIHSSYGYITDNRANNSYIHVFEKTRFWFGQDTRNLHPLMQQLFYELENRYIGYMTQVETLLQQLVVQVIRNYEYKNKSINQFRHTNLVDSKYLVIEECFLYEYRDLSLGILSKRLGLSPRQTERLLKEHYGRTFLQKKAEAKMSAAAIMLLDKDKRITDIALESGYSSVEHFSNAFKNYYKESARNFRKTH